MGNDIPDLNLFMLCDKSSISAYKELPDGFTFRHCRHDELEVWKHLQVIDEYYDFISEYFDNVYKPRGDLFFDKCVFVCDSDNKPVGSCFLWQAYGKINTLHWFKVADEYQGRGLGRALLTHLFKDLTSDDFPIFIHTHPSSFKAIKLYSDFGFKLINTPLKGNRNNDYIQSLPYLKKHMTVGEYEKLATVQAPDYFVDIVAKASIDEF